MTTLANNTDNNNNLGQQQQQPWPATTTLAINNLTTTTTICQPHQQSVVNRNLTIRERERPERERPERERPSPTQYIRLIGLSFEFHGPIGFPSSQQNSSLVLIRQTYAIGYNAFSHSLLYRSDEVTRSFFLLLVTHTHTHSTARLRTTPTHTHFFFFKFSHNG